MAVPASLVFDFLGEPVARTVDRYEIACGPFRVLRKNAYHLTIRLIESEEQDAAGIAFRLRSLLSEWLTVPVEFTEATFGVVNDLLGATELVETRWGAETRTFYENFLSSAKEISSIESPMRAHLRATIQQLLSEQTRFKIFCHRQARRHFDSLFPEQELARLSDVYLHSIVEYREAELFDALIKVGPLRARGWGQVPDALITAPRFYTLVQHVWSGCSDAPDFGYDPASLSLAAHSEEKDSHIPLTTAAATYRGPLKWVNRIIPIGGNVHVRDYDAKMDELRMFTDSPRRPPDSRPATLVLVDDNQAILYPIHSQVLSFDPAPFSDKPFDQRLPGETLREGMFVIRPSLADIDLGGVHAEHGYYSKKWKERLYQEWESDSPGLVARLQTAGLRLAHLPAAIRHWCKPPSTVVHAPQQINHFRILLSVLGIENEFAQEKARTRTSLWQLAWSEIRRSRGEAIQAGVIEHEIVEDEILRILGEATSPLRERATNGSGFRFTLPDSSGLKGELLFLKVCGVEDGFSAPDAELKIVRDLETVEQWRD